MKALLTLLLSAFAMIPLRIYASETPEVIEPSGEILCVESSNEVIPSNETIPSNEVISEAEDIDNPPGEAVVDDSVKLSINPFSGLSVEALERMIAEYEERKLKRKDSGRLRLYEGDSHELTMENLIRVVGEAGLSNQLYVLAQAVLETGNFKSNVCRNYNNLFGLYNSRKKEYYRFHRWEDSVIGYKKFIQHRYKGGNYLAFLKRIGYAEDPGYVRKVAKIANRLYRDLFKN